MTTTNNELILTRLIHAPRTAVWKAWTVAKYTAQWWGPHGFTTPVCELDMRPDGPIRIDMRAPDGIVYPMTGTYLEIAEPKLLIFTSSALDANGTPLFKVLTAVTLVAQEHHTKLILHATVSESTPEAAPFLEGMETGWTQSLERLDYVVVQEMHDASLAPSSRCKVVHVWFIPAECASHRCSVYVHSGRKDKTLCFSCRHTAERRNSPADLAIGHWCNPRNIRRPTAAPWIVYASCRISSRWRNGCSLFPVPLSRERLAGDERPDTSKWNWK